MKRDKRRLNPGFLEALQFYTNVTMRIGVSLLLGFLAGYMLDFRLRTQPWLSIIGFFLGAGLGFWSVYDLIRLTLEKTKSKSKRRRSMR
ncbi:MAG: AtpZ/AtpI family protein [Firmicutes bacterium]|jgi:F0F1-type ATP synthase assembly protein I|nr:AtpZ/AtpI family protein [Bacillota bacterium]HXL04527.1 AtpZ/AtpI family protein [Bacillota bacterium]